MALVAALDLAVDLADLLFALEEAVGRPEVPGLTRPGTAALAPADAEEGGDEAEEGRG